VSSPSSTRGRPTTTCSLSRSRPRRAIGREVDEPRENGLAGTPEEVVDKIGRYGDLEHLELAAAEVLPQV